MYNTVNTLLDTSKIIDIREILEQQESAADIYYKTDHHWTLQGAYAAYREYCNTTGIQKHSYGSFNPEKVSGSFMVLFIQRFWISWQNQMKYMQ